MENPTCSGSRPRVGDLIIQARHKTLGPDRTHISPFEKGARRYKYYFKKKKNMCAFFYFYYRKRVFRFVETLRRSLAARQTVRIFRSMIIYLNDFPMCPTTFSRTIKTIKIPTKKTVYNTLMLFRSISGLETLPVYRAQFRTFLPLFRSRI